MALLTPPAFSQSAKVLVNHIGYEKTGPKQAVVLGTDVTEVNGFKLLQSSSGKEVFSGKTVKAGPVHRWKNWYFWTADFSAVTNEGTYLLEVSTAKGPVQSFPFDIQHDVLERNTLSDVLFYFKGQRCSGLLDKADRHIKLDEAVLDVHGGWYDASGDYGKHLSHLSYSTYFNPQQTPLVVWSLFKTLQELERRGDPNFRQYKRRLLDEALYGADFLVRMKNPTGSFYRSVGAPGPEKKPEDRRIGREGRGFSIKTVETKNKFSAMDTNAIAARFPYEVGFRAGGGVSIAALACAASQTVPGHFSSETYLQAAEDAFEYVGKYNELYANDGKENIVDDYCALLAATELFRATHADKYKAAADTRARQLINRLIVSGQHTNYWRADDRDRPFFHAADAGMPVVSLLNYADIADEPTRGRLLDTVRKSMEFELRVTDEVTNPFGYARQFVQTTNGIRRSAFFFPHDTETAPWWQGENARLASLATAARMAARQFGNDPEFQGRLERYAWNQLSWILGLNPFDCCMLHGKGRNNIPYMFFESYEYSNAPGGICNGISGGYANPDDIDFDLRFTVTGKDNDWRWGEQWLPHAAWYLMAIAVR